MEEHAHALPYFLGWLENIEYPKSRTNLQFFLNSNEDSSSEQLKWYVEILLAKIKNEIFFQEPDCLKTCTLEILLDLSYFNF